MYWRDTLTSGRGAQILGAVATLIGSIWLVLWFTGIAPRWAAEGLNVVKTNMALAQVLAGVALVWLSPGSRNPVFERLGLFSAAVVFLIGALTLSQHLFSYDLGIDQLLASEPPGAAATASPNRIGPPGASSLILLGAGLALLVSRRSRLAPWFGVGTCVLNLIPTVGFLYGISQFYSNPRMTGIAWSTVIALLTLGAGLILARPLQGPAAQLLRDDPGGVLLRRLVPAVILTPLLLGFLHVQGERHGFYDTAVGTGTLTIIIVVGFLFILWTTAATLSQSAEAKAKAEADLRSVALFTEEDPFPVLRVGPEGKLLYANRSAKPLLDDWHCARGQRTPESICQLIKRAIDKGEREELEVRVGEQTFAVVAAPVAGREYANLYVKDITDRKAAEDTLRIKEQHLRAIVNASHDAIVLADDQGRYVEANPAVEGVFGLPPTALIGRFIYEFIEPEFDFFGTWATFRQQGKLSGEYRIVRADGTQIDAESFSVANVLPGLHLSVIRDITERKQAEDGLRRERDFSAALLDTAGAAVVVMDKQGRITRFNRACIALTGYSEKEALGRAVWDFLIPAEELSGVRETWAALKAGDFPNTHENHWLAKDGARRLISWSNTVMVGADGEIAHVIGTGIDITERQQAEEALRQSEARLTQAVRVAGLGTFQHDHQADLIEYSPAMRELQGFEPDEKITIAALVEKVMPEDRQALAAAIRRAHEPGGDGLFEADYRVRRSSGDVRWVSARSQTFFAGEGKDRRPVRTIGVALDVTERREVQAHLERLVAERTAKLQELVGELEHFSYSITHDMRAPLRAMRSFGELAHDLCAESGPRDLKEFLRRIMTAAERMDSLITDALSYSRAVRQQLPVENVDTGALLRGMLDTYPEMQASRARIEVQGELPVVLGNEAGLTQCFSNLLGNAVKFAKPGQPPEIRVRAEKRPGWARIWVEDNGIGISKEMLPRVFDMFSRGSNNYPGTGIGLALVRKVLDRMGGKVGAESEEGKGSRFWLELPTDPAPSIPAESPADHGQ